jgi:hypothetical protein
MSVMEYANKFNHLAQYSRTHVDTDEKRRDHFYRGLSCILQKEVYTRNYQTFGILMNTAIAMEVTLRLSGSVSMGSLDLLVSRRLRWCRLSRGCPTTPQVDSHLGSLSRHVRHHLPSTEHLLSRCSSLRDSRSHLVWGRWSSLMLVSGVARRATMLRSATRTGLLSLLSRQPTLA